MNIIFSIIAGHKYEELFPCIQWLSPFAKAIHQQQVKPIKHFEKVKLYWLSYTHTFL